MELMDWAIDGRDAVEKIKKLDILPDVILMDIAMPRMDGISAIKEILAFNNSIKIVMLTAFGDKLHVQGAFDAGAIGFLRKDAGLPLIKEAIKQAARGGRPVHKEVAHYLKEEMN
jgi:DNA-binding NarL/FixJ family response regulator